ncbi:TATA binding protein-associated phosphoprotein [Rhodotorula toruloides]|uniref:TATA binding protein-associated phosphoprotein n=1 Tax=Rhodotorula toruloides TaxID=5286 RepID=A0A511KHT9_RHOTO|nr:TATA binding protein-associated phosphoprotein [Rhodotorula toruloides]
MNSDDEGPRTGGGGDDEVALPKSTINKLIAEFLLAVSSEANEICEKDSKKTMLPDHALGFEEFVSGVEDVLADHKEVKKASPASRSLRPAPASDHLGSRSQGEKAKKAKKAAGNGMTEEEMLRIQEELFAKSRARMDAGEGSAPAAPGEGEGAAKEEKQE